MAKNDLRRGAVPGSAPGGPTGGQLDGSDPWDAIVLEEARLLQLWTGIPATLVHSTDGTAACSDNTIYIDRKQLEGFFGKFTGEKYKTAIFFALAHEFGHLSQFAVYGVDRTFAMPSIEVEAHADYLSGAWLGLRLVQGQERLSEDVFEAGIQLKAGTDDYPTAYQRGRLVQDAMGLSVLLAHIVEPQIRGIGYDKLETALNSQDVVDLYRIARDRLREIPKQP